MTKPPPKVYHTKGKDDWGTTQGLFDTLNEEFDFDLDVCANDLNHKCANYLTQEMDALSIDWWGRCFMNPPHSQTDLFLTRMAKMLVDEKIQLGVAVVASRTDTAVHHMASCFAGEIRYLKGRLSYEVFPTANQRTACEILQACAVETAPWQLLVKEIGLPQTAILALMKDPTIPGGDPRLAQSAPFPSLVYIFDRRPEQRTVYWDWKTKQRTVYVYTGYKQAQKVPHAPWLHTMVAGHKTGKLSAAKAAFADLTVSPTPVLKSTPIFTLPPDQPKMFFLDPEGLKQVEAWQLPKLLGGSQAALMPGWETPQHDDLTHATELATMEVLLTDVTDEEETDGT